MDRLPALLVLMLCATGCPGGGNDDVVTCGPGTTLNGRACVPDLVGGNNGGNNGAASTCGPGTVLDPVNNVCEVENANITECGPGTSLNPDTEQCEATGPQVSCADGTTEVAGECVADNPCPDGEVFRNGACIPGAALCGQGTVWRAGECVPFDPLVDVVDTEGAENNDPAYGGTATPVVPGVDGDVTLVKGTIGPAEDLDGDEDGTLDPDFDGFVFEAVAGQRLMVQATAVGAPSVALEVAFLGDGGYLRAAIPFGDRNAQRQIVAPWTGSYLVRVGELSNFAGVGGVPQGAEGFTYLFGIATLAAQAPTPLAPDGEVSGDIRTLPQFSVETQADAVAIRLITDPAVASVWFATSPDFSVYAGAQTYLRVPEGGLLVTADYVDAAALDTEFTLTATAATLVDEVEPNQSAEDATRLGTTSGLLAGAGDFAVVDADAETTTEDWWAFSTDGGTVEVGTSFRSTPADTTLTLYAAGDLEQAIDFDDDGAGLYSVLTAELAAGDYVAVVRSFDEQTDGDYFLSVLRN